MSAYAVALIKNIQPETMQEYAKLAQPTIAAWNGRVLAKGALNIPLAGNHDAEVITIIEFAKPEDIEAWYNSAEYQAAIPVREQACDMTLLTFNT